MPLEGTEKSTPQGGIEKNDRLSGVRHYKTAVIEMIGKVNALKVGFRISVGIKILDPC
jgi:hypothetical protein